MTAPIRHPNETASDYVLRVLSDEIVAGLLRPGIALDEVGLAKRFNVSRTPVREALSQLATRGLAEKRPHRGTIVISVPQEKVLEMFEVMAELEGVCARLAAERMTKVECAELERLHAESEKVARQETSDDYALMNVRFHKLIYSGAHNEEIIKLAENMRKRLSPFRSAQFHLQGRPAQSHAEHAQIVKAISEGNGEKAYAAMRGHMLAVRKAYSGYTHQPNHMT